jgi:hypothetical protein
MNRKHAWPSVDILFSLLLIALSLFIIIESVIESRPLLASEQATLLDMPGLSPIICSALLIGLSVAMIVSAYRKGGRLGWFFSGELSRALSGREARAVYKVFALLLAYVFLLWPHLPFWLSTTVFLIGFMAAFGVFSWTSVLTSGLTVAMLWYVFLELFNIALPSRFVFGG